MAPGTWRKPSLSTLALCLVAIVLAVATDVATAGNSDRDSRNDREPVVQTTTRMFGPRQHCMDVKNSADVKYYYDGAGNLYLVPESTDEGEAATAEAVAQVDVEATAVDGALFEDACAGFTSGRLLIWSFETERFGDNANVNYSHRPVSPPGAEVVSGAFRLKLDQEQVFGTSSKYDTKGTYIFEVKVSTALELKSARPTPSAPTPSPPFAPPERSCNCTKDLNVVCGTDGKDYDNACLARCARVGVRSSGSCPERPGPVSEPEPECMCTEHFSPVCGKDNITYGNSCFARCKKVGYVPGACADTRPTDPICSCTKELNIVCGTDGKEYNNACLARCARVGVRAPGSCPERPTPEPEPEPEPECMCTEQYSPVCGTDNKTYDNSCFARCKSVKFVPGVCDGASVTDTTEMSCKSRCAKSTTVSAGPVCLHYNSEVTDGFRRTFTNRCFAECDLKENMRIEDGRCDFLRGDDDDDDHAAGPTLSKVECERQCPRVYKPVCLRSNTDERFGRNFTNECSAMCHMQDDQFVETGRCTFIRPEPEDNESGCVCAEIYDPVCSYDGTTYGNACNARCAGVMYMPGACPTGVSSKSLVEQPVDTSQPMDQWNINTLSPIIQGPMADSVAASTGNQAVQPTAPTMQIQSKKSSTETIAIVMIVLSVVLLSAILSVTYIRTKRQGGSATRRFSNFQNNGCFDYSATAPHSPGAAAHGPGVFNPEFGFGSGKAGAPRAQSAAGKPTSGGTELMRSTSGADSLEFSQRGSLDSYGMPGEEQHAVVVTRSPLFDVDTRGEHSAVDVAGGVNGKTVMMSNGVDMI